MAIVRESYAEFPCGQVMSGDHTASIEAIRQQPSREERDAAIVNYAARTGSSAASVLAEVEDREPAPRPTHVELTPLEREALTTAAALSPIEYGRIRTDLAARLGVGLMAVDAELDAIRSKLGANGRPASQGTAIAFHDPELWPSPVDGVELLDELTATFRRFLALPEHAGVALAFWTVHAHAHDATDISPVLAITSPVLGCGKTTALEILGALAPRPMHAANLTAAVTFRTVEKFRPTLLVDEADTFLRHSDELRGVLNSGHRRRSAQVPRTVGDDHEPRMFSTWAPKAVAVIGRLPGTLADRSIEVAMRRRAREERVERMRLDRLDELEPIRRRAWTWAQANLDALRAADPDVPQELRDRAADNWRPLLAIADQACGEWPGRARSAALALSGVTEEDDQPAGILALHDVAALFDERGVDRLASETIVNHLITLDERPWPEWSHGKALSKRGLARFLKPFGIRPRLVKIDGTPLRGYRREDFSDALSRYAPPLQVFPPLPARTFGPNGDSPQCYLDPQVTDAKSAGKPLPGPKVAEVTDEKGGSGREGVSGSVSEPEEEPSAFRRFVAEVAARDHRHPLWSEGGRDTLGDL